MLKDYFWWLCGVVLFISDLKVAETSLTPPYIGRAVELVKQVLPGENVQFSCDVYYQGTFEVSWWYLDHNVQLSSNTDILAANDDNRFVLEKKQVSEFLTRWMLTIKDVITEDRGHYKCMVNTGIAQIHTLLVNDGPSSMPSTPEHHDFTDCCVKANVSGFCLPICASWKHENINLDACLVDLPKLLKCGTDGRNHAPCCHRRLLPSKCLGFCTNVIPTTLDSSLNVCLDKISDIVECFESGQVLLPSPPEKVWVKDIEETSMTIIWSPPKESSQSVTGNKVFYKKYKDSSYKSTKRLLGYGTSLMGLESNTLYKIHVIALSEFGSSLPSYSVVARTGTTGITIVGSNETLIECCGRRHVPKNCLETLCGMEETSSSDIVDLSCYSHYSKVSACVAGEKDHSQCCKDHGIPDYCDSICAGQGITNMSTQLECISGLMPAIGSCFAENSELLPGPPSDVRLTDVSSSHILVQWQPPVSNPDKVEEYILLYRTVPYKDMPTKVPLDSSILAYKIDNLRGSTLYEITIRSISETGSSLPSPALQALTYYTDESAIFLPAVQPSDTQPVSAIDCCRNVGVKSNCEMLCDYEYDFNSMSQAQVFACTQDIGLALHCGSGGRNNSECCRERGVTPSCLDFCSFRQEEGEPFQIDFSHIECIAQIPSVVACMQSGIGVVPTHPRNLTLYGRSSSTLTVAWQPPVSFPGRSDRHYFLQYRKLYRNLNDTWIPVNVAMKLSYILQNLESDTDYEVVVYAKSNSAISLPSEKLTASTSVVEGDGPPIANQNFTIPANVTQCCRDRGVVGNCLAGCSGTGIIDPTQCSEKLADILHCSTDKRNHQDCCRRNGIPKQCWHLCSGKEEPATAASVFCFTFVEQLFTCYHHGYGKIPSPPRNVRVTKVTKTEISISWEKPSRNSDGITYSICDSEQYSLVISCAHFDKYSGSAYKSSHTHKFLKPGTFYELYMYALNDYGSSQRSDLLTVMTSSDQDSGSIEVLQEPSGYVKSGDTVSLMCWPNGKPYSAVYWERNKDGFKSEGADLTLHDIKQDANSPPYICHVMSEGNLYTKSWYFKVQVMPMVHSVRDVVYVQTYVGDSALLECQFDGFPDTISWAKDGKTLGTGKDTRYSNVKKEDGKSGVLIAGLTIQAVITEDLGFYTCTGSNSYGEDSTRVSLLDVATKSDEPIPIAPLVNNITACCLSRGVQAECQDSCKYSIDLLSFTSMSNPLTCLTDLPHLVECAADGKNHSKCCESKSIPDACLSFCGGVVGVLDASHVQCLEYINPILGCMRDGNVNRPAPPTQVTAQFSDKGYVSVFWNKPSFSENVNKYVIYYRTPKADLLFDDVWSSETSYTIQGVLSNAEYTVYVKSWNIYGTSAPSNEVTVMTTELNPSEPGNVRWKPLNDRFVRVYWDLPKQHPGSVQSYDINYRIVGSGAKFTTVNTKTPTTSFRLGGLKPNENYEVTVKAKSSSGLTKASNLINIKFDAGKITGNENDSADKGSSAALGVGIFFVVLISIVIVVIAIIYIRRARKKSNLFGGAVAFENPQYQTGREAKVLGLPANDDEDEHVYNKLEFAETDNQQYAQLETHDHD